MKTMDGRLSPKIVQLYANIFFLLQTIFSLLNYVTNPILRTKNGPTPSTDLNKLLYVGIRFLNKVFKIIDGNTIFLLPYQWLSFWNSLKNNNNKKNWIVNGKLGMLMILFSLIWLPLLVGLCRKHLTLF